MRNLLFVLLIVVSQSHANTNEKHVVTTSSIQSGYITETIQKTHDDTVVSRHESQSDSINYWFHDVWLSLNTDYDYDGFASGFTLEFDIDSFFNQTRVYAVVYLGTGNRFESLYTTQSFNLISDSSNDRVTLDFELATGYPTNDYNVLIEVFDANTHGLLTYVDDTNFAALYLVPLESQNYESTTSEFTVVERHGGAIGLPLIVGALVLLLWQRRCRKPVGFINREL
jgi:hypothetical protein